jgi:hypothetical protein
VVNIGREVVETPVLVYTDASFHWVLDRGHEMPHAVLGFYVIDPVTGVEIYGGGTLPVEFYAYFSKDLRTYITQAELLVAVAIYYTCAPLLRRRVVHFIDNTGALSALVHGYASKADCARMVNVYHVQAAALGAQFWGEWVPSKANPGDIPTRPERAHEMEGMARRITIKLPRVADIEAHPREQVRRARAEADGWASPIEWAEAATRGATGTNPGVR